VATTDLPDPRTLWPRPAGEHGARLPHFAAMCGAGRFERRLFDGVVEPVHGRVRPPGDAPGLGLRVRTEDVEDLRIG
jgi:hypothetical protein